MYSNQQINKILPPPQLSPCSTSNSDLSGQTSVFSTKGVKEEKKNWISIVKNERR